jgi:hypothetical protein
LKVITVEQSWPSSKNGRLLRNPASLSPKLANALKSPAGEPDTVQDISQAEKSSVIKVHSSYFEVITDPPVTHERQTTD